MEQHPCHKYPLYTENSSDKNPHNVADTYNTHAHTIEDIFRLNNLHNFISVSHRIFSTAPKKK